MNQIVQVLVAIVGVAMIAVLVSRNAQTANVIGATGEAFGNALAAATGPVGSSYTPTSPRVGTGLM